ncbi:hypothetical protein [Auritidibacter sp. NML100628]|uniref:hypothetical protein n=1 Tax=Auritidibacter sp. NML100628 TaxID=2170742 RepID=UPI000D735C5E|nr:hypothetical protein [Auritidibacter sp. NML100628]PXA77875.1 hypothetical protein DCC24_02965 [Auritidibacter sp. NML100628]
MFTVTALDGLAPEAPCDALEVTVDLRIAPTTQTTYIKATAAQPTADTLVVRAAGDSSDRTATASTSEAPRDLGIQLRAGLEELQSLAGARIALGTTLGQVEFDKTVATGQLVVTAEQPGLITVGDVIRPIPVGVSFAQRHGMFPRMPDGLADAWSSSAENARFAPRYEARLEGLWEAGLVAGLHPEVQWAGSEDGEVLELSLPGEAEQRVFLIDLEEPNSQEEIDAVQDLDAWMTEIRAELTEDLH